MKVCHLIAAAALGGGVLAAGIPLSTRAPGWPSGTLAGAPAPVAPLPAPVAVAPRPGAVLPAREVPLPKANLAAARPPRRKARSPLTSTPREVDLPAAADLAAVPPAPDWPAASPALTARLPVASPALAAPPVPVSLPVASPAAADPPASPGNGIWKEQPSRREPPELRLINRTGMDGTLVIYEGLTPRIHLLRAGDDPLSVVLQPGEYRYQVFPTTRIGGIPPDVEGTLRCRRFHLYQGTVTLREPGAPAGTIEQDLGDAANSPG